MTKRHILGAVALVASAAVAAQTPPMTPDIPSRGFDAVTPQADYVRREVMIPMRDGKKLFTVIVMRKGTNNAPILLTRTPYNAAKTTAATRARGSRRYCRSPTPSSSRTAISASIRMYAAATGPKATM